MTTTAPSIEDFLAQPSTPEDDIDSPDSAAPISDPLASIADSLSRLADHFDARQTFTGEVITGEVGETEADRYREAYDDLEGKHQVLFTLVEQIEAEVAKSVAKPSLAVKALIEAWRNPEVPEAEEARVPEPCAPGCLAEGDHTETGCVLHPEQPLNDADVEEWRTYARELRGVEFCPTNLDSMNRSQIRTFLGIEHPDAG